MALKLSSIQVDLAAQSDGEWRPVPEWKGVRLKCRSLEYPPYQKDREAALLQAAKEHDPDPVPDEEWTVILGELLAQHILLGWDGFDVEFSPKMADEMLRDPSWKVLRRKVIEVANQIGHRDLVFIGTAVKNSEAPSATS